MAKHEGERPVIIIKKIKKVAGGHHGGAWKVAYADFVTAMMAFFLLLWLLSSTTEEQRSGIADYFDPVAVSTSESGSGGILGGMSPTEPGAQISQAMPRATVTTDPGIAQMSDAEKSDKPAEEDSQADQSEPKDLKKVEDEKLQEEVKRREEESFEKAKDEIMQQIKADDELKGLAANLIIDETPEGLRIQVTDRDGKPMFPLSGSQMLPDMQKILGLITRVVQKMPNKISLRGHTDSTPFKSGGVDNWDLSTDRANSSRRAMVQSGLDPSRLASVVGRADSEHLVPENPESPQNRRVSIILLRDQPANTAK